MLCFGRKSHLKYQMFYIFCAWCYSLVLHCVIFVLYMCIFKCDTSHLFLLKLRLCWVSFPSLFMVMSEERCESSFGFTYSSALRSDRPPLFERFSVDSWKELEGRVLVYWYLLGCLTVAQIVLLFRGLLWRRSALCFNFFLIFLIPTFLEDWCLFWVILFRKPLSCGLLDLAPKLSRPIDV